MLTAFILFVCLGASMAVVPQAPLLSRRATGPYTTVDLIAAEPAPAVGAVYWIALRFNLEPGWHVYWQNPGDSGSPPALRWQLPDGVRAGDIEWPAPERIEAGTLVNYGYENGVVLPIPLRVGARLKPAQVIHVGLQVKWLVCKDLCVPGQARLDLRVPLTDADRAEVLGWKRLIDQARARVPKPAPVAWKTSARSTKDSFVVTIDTGRREGEGVFFPLDVSQINDSAPQQVRPRDRGLEMTLRKSDQLSAEPTQLRGVLALPGRPAHVVEARVEK